MRMRDLVHAGLAISIALNSAACSSSLRAEDGIVLMSLQFESPQQLFSQHPERFPANVMTPRAAVFSQQTAVPGELKVPHDAQPVVLAASQTTHPTGRREAVRTAEQVSQVSGGAQSAAAESGERAEAGGASEEGDELEQADEALIYQQPEYANDYDLGAMILKLTVGTLGVSVACVCCLVLLRRFLPNKFQGTVSAASQQMQTVESLTIKNRGVLELVRVSQQYVLVGFDSGGLKAIVPLAASFSDAYEELEEESVTEPEPGSASDHQEHTTGHSLLSDLPSGRPVREGI